MRLNIKSLTRAISLMGYLLIAQQSSAQYFSEDPATFVSQATRFLRYSDHEAYLKIGQDFQDVWSQNFQTAHRDTIIYISREMENKRYAYNNYHRYFLSYVAEAVAEKGVQADQLSRILAINVEALHSLSKKEYFNFLYEMNAFFVSGLIHRTRNTSVVSEGGTFSFELLGASEPAGEAYIPVEEEVSEEEILQQQLQQSQPAQDPFTQQPPASDPFAANSGFGNQQNQTADPDPFNTDPFASTGFGNQQAEETPAADPFNTDPFSNTDSGNQQPQTADPFASDPFSNTSGFGSTTAVEDPYAPVETQNTPAPQEVSRAGSVAYKEDFVAIMQGQYPVPPKSGPVLNLLRTNLVLVSPYDSLILKGVSGTQLLKEKVFVGDGASLQWPKENPRTQEVSIEMEEFFMKVDRGNFWTPNAKLTFPPFINEPLPGVFKYQSITRKRGELSSYPIFTSYYADASFDLLGGDATYEGGIEIKGNKVFGNSVSRDPNYLTINDGKGRKAVITSRKFTLGDSLITANDASFSFFHGSDSIYHPRVSLYYYPHDREMTVIVRKGNEATPFNNSYHRVQISAEVFRWNIERDSIDFDIVSAKNLIPVTIASDDYFSDLRYQRMSGSFDFHPISIAVYFAKKYGVTDFNYADLVSEYDINERLVYGAMVQLEQYNFVVFNEKSGHVTVLDKAFLFYDASARKRDFDNLFIPSKLEGLPNASMNLDSMELLVRGVADFYMTTDYKVRVKPLDQELKILRNRQLLFNGEIEAGDFDYKGHDFIFDYDAFLIEMTDIDSIRLQITLPDSLSSESGEKKSLQNHLTETSGILYLNEPADRANSKNSTHFPYFESDSEAIVYFDGEEVLNGAYDKSVKFIIPPLEVDDIDREDATSIQFPGMFNSGGIFPNFEDTLHIMPDNSLGFVHQIPEEGYVLYGTPAKTYENITLSSDGMRGQGKIDFLNATIFSEDFVYYPDSVTADGYFGTIVPGQVGEASFPEAEMGSFRMYWLPKKDSMFLRTIDDPFSFYGATAKLTGAANVTQKGVYGYGSLLTRGSIAESENLSFKELTYAATHANFTVLSDDPEKPAMAGDDINLFFDLTTNTADIHPEQIGVAAISFPYAQMKTSITNATWFLEDSVITMTKPEDVSLQDTYFYSIRPELDSLAFNAEKAIYDIKSYELNVQGIPYIFAADAKIVPEGNETTILANSKLQTFTNAEIIFQYPEAYHYLSKGVIDIQSSKSFSGSAVYMLPIEEDTFEIKMSSFYLQERFLPGGITDSISVSNGLVSKSTKIDVSPGFLYQGGVVLKADKQALELSGFVKPDFETLPDHDVWIAYERTDDQTEVTVDMASAVFEDGEAAIAGMHYGSSGRVYHTFLEKRFSPADDDFYRATGMLSYDEESKMFKIEDVAKSTGEQYQGHTFYYSDTSQAIIFEGPANFLATDRNLITVEASLLGSGNRESNEYEADVFFTMDFKLDVASMEPMATDLIDIIERLGNPPANDLSLVAMLKVANVIGEEATKKYEKGSFKDYIPLFEASSQLEKNLVISGVNMVWNNERNAWHNTTKLSISNVNDRDINAKMDGFIEFGRDDTGGEVMNLFIQAAPGSWYYFNYQENSLLVFSSNKTFNEQIGAKSNFGAAKPGELVLILGDENETLKFLNEFRRVYFGVEEPYNLVYPDELSVDDESFDTIQDEEEDDDGFGF